MERKSLHIPILDTLRGLAAFSVCFYHLILFPVGFINNHTVGYIAHFGSYGVQVFFIISGIVIPLSMINMEYKFRKMKSFLIKRVLRIEPPYIVAVILAVVYFNLRNYIGGTAKVDVSPNVRDVLLHIGYLVPFVSGAKWINIVFWTLSIEFQYYLFLALLFPLVLNFNKWRFAFYLIVFSLPFTNINDEFFPYWSAYFSLGIFYALFITGKIPKAEFGILILLASAVIFFRHGINTTHTDYAIPDLLIGWSSLLVIHFFANFKSIIGTKLGQISYSLYLTHSIVGIPIINIVTHRVSSIYGKLIVLVAALSASVVFAYYFFKFIEKPSQELSKKVKIPV
jgi:peptidoglycan/LPS O-acetylase OafA/YrhL